MTQRDYYEVLGVKRDAEDEDIRKAYRQKAKSYHPDSNPDDPTTVDKFKEASSAYEVLGDPQKRAGYDRYGHDAPKHGHPQGDIFSSFFGGGRPRQERGMHLQVQLDVDLVDAFKGCKKDILVERKNPCDKCSGSGAKETAKCDLCHGTGQCTIRQDPFVLQTTCNKCQGVGIVKIKDCEDCKGTGFDKTTKETIFVDVPPGVHDGNQLRLSGQGQSHPNGPPGDLFVIIHVKKHKFLDREGNNLVCEIPVSYTQLALGAEVEIPTIEGKTKFKIPAGSQPSHKFRLSGLGMPDVRSPSNKGNLYAIVKLDVPTKLSKKYEEILRKLEKFEKNK